MKIYWTLRAAKRLEEIHQYISCEDVTRADDFINKIFERVDSLCENPERGRIVPEVNENNIREIFCGEYRIVYKVELKVINLLTIRNFKQLLKHNDL